MEKRFFYSIFYSIGGVQQFLKICCSNCTEINEVKTFRNISEVNPESIRYAHFVYPFLGSVTDRLVNGYLFLLENFSVQIFIRTRQNSAWIAGII